MVGSTFIKCFMFYQMKRGAATKKCLVFSANE